MNNNNDQNSTMPTPENLNEKNFRSGFAISEKKLNECDSVQDGDSNDFIADVKNWFFKNNPFYLLSVFFMFWGLYLVSVDTASGRGPESLKSIITFYAVQNVYEIIMIVMAVYLLHNRINQPHGRLLFFFTLIFLCDATMYQSAISSTCDLKTIWVGAAVSSVYFIMAAVKLSLLIHFLRITVHYAPLFYSLFSFAMIYFTPQAINYMILTKNNAGVFASYQFQCNVWWIFYFIMSVAALSQLPVILSGWNKSREDFLENRENKYFGASELLFYKIIVVIPFIAVAVQMFLNAAQDLKSIDPGFKNYCYCFVPYIFLSAFLIQSVYKKTIVEFFPSLNIYDFFVTIAVFSFAVITKPLDISMFGDTAFYPHRINLAIIFASNILFIITRKNYLSLSFLIFAFLSYTRTYSYVVAEYFYSSYIMRAITFIIASFVMLGAGFAISVHRPAKSVNTSNISDENIKA